MFKNRFGLNNKFDSTFPAALSAKVISFIYIVSFIITIFNIIIISICYFFITHIRLLLKSSKQALTI